MNPLKFGVVCQDDSSLGFCSLPGTRGLSKASGSPSSLAVMESSCTRSAHTMSVSADHVWQLLMVVLQQGMPSSVHTPANLKVSQQMMTGRPRAWAVIAVAAVPTREMTVPLDMTPLAPSSTLVTSCACRAGLRHTQLARNCPPRMAVETQAAPVQCSAQAVSCSARCQRLGAMQGLHVCCMGSVTATQAQMVPACPSNVPA